MLLSLEEFKQKQIIDKIKEKESIEYKKCSNGHILSPNNLYTYRKNGNKQVVCNICRVISNKKYKRINGKLVRVVFDEKEIIIKQTTIQISERQKTRDKRLQFILSLGGKCVKCNFSDWRALQVDHVNGRGRQETLKLGCASNTYKNKVIKSINNNKNEYQLLCANCNWIKRYENDEVRIT